MSKITFNEVGIQAPGMLTRNYRATYQWIKNGKIYRQMNAPSGRNWVAIDDTIIPSEGSRYKDWRGKLDQVGTNPPTASAVFVNDFDEDLEFVYFVPGQYAASFPTLTGIFTAGKTEFPGSTLNVKTGFGGFTTTQGYEFSEDMVGITTSLLISKGLNNPVDGSTVDDVMSNVQFNIRVWN